MQLTESATEEYTMSTCSALRCGDEVDPHERVDAATGGLEGREQRAQLVQCSIYGDVRKEGSILLHHKCVCYFDSTLYDRDCLLVKKLSFG